jgi:hypothetical protein
VLPETAPQPERLSRGSLLHGTGECKPCAGFWKPQGCDKGKECFHCHTCPPGEIYARKRSKAKIMRAAATAAQEATAEETAPCVRLTIAPFL